MSDIERICEINHERRKWADEIEEEQATTSAAKIRNDKKLEKANERAMCLRTVCTACAMLCGSGAAFAGMGIAMGHWQTVALGAVIGVVFLLTGCRAEGMLEDCREGRGDHV